MPRLVNQHPAPALVAQQEVDLHPVWVRVIWHRPDGSVDVHHEAAVALLEVGMLVLCEWDEPQAEARWFWMHRVDVTPRATAT